MAKDAFAALAHPIRREIVERLSGGVATVGEASRDIGVSKPTISRHLKLLEDAGLVTRVIDGRTHRLGLRPQALADASGWIETQRTRWERLFDIVDDYLEERKMTEHRQRVLRIERTFDAPAERVFDAWTSEPVLRRWLHAMPGWETPTAEVDLRVGGRIRIVMRDPSDGAEHGATGEYTVVDPPRRLVFTWLWDDDPENPQVIELEFSEGQGGTTVVMTNSAIPTHGRLKNQERGWHGCYDNLDRVLAG